MKSLIRSFLILLVLLAGLVRVQSLQNGSCVFRCGWDSQNAELGRPKRWHWPPKTLEVGQSIRWKWASSKRWNSIIPSSVIWLHAWGVWYASFSVFFTGDYPRDSWTLSSLPFSPNCEELCQQTDCL